MRLEIDPVAGESARACAAIARAALPPSRAGLIMIALYGAVVAAAAILAPATLAETALVGVGAVLATATILRAEGRSRLRRAQDADPHALETHYVELGPDGVRAWCAHVDARYPWREFTKVDEDNEFYLIVRPSGSGVAVPKRLLDAASEAELRERLHAWAPDGGAGLAREMSGTAPAA